MHLFLLVPNNSGSSVLHDLIATSSDVAILPNEGQFCPNFIGPLAHTFGVAHFFTKKEGIFKNEKNYEWGVIKNQWTSLWKKDNPTARVFLQKSPPDILRADMPHKTFEDTKFIIMVRNPYAQVESILRANPTASLEDAATHAIRCLEIQLENSEQYLEDLVFRYEDLTDKTEETIKNIEEFLNISNLDSDKVFETKAYVSKIRNMNDDQIKKLTDKQIVTINSIFSKKIDVLEECGYSLIEPSSFNFKLVGEVNVTEFQNKLEIITDEFWNEFTYRQDTFEVHAKTLTVPIIFSEDFESENVQYQKYFKYFSDELLKLSKVFQEKHGFGYITRAILVNLKANSTIPSHVDSGESLHACHRMHIPLITNEHCKFSVGEDTINMKTGEIWEINNTNKLHSVNNSSNTDRIHLIADWIVVKT
jgi:hypothetical protein